jgi:hypothetical protein
MTAHTATANGLYYELRGAGPAVLLIAGATGDAGQLFAQEVRPILHQLSS